MHYIRFSKSCQDVVIEVEEKLALFGARLRELRKEKKLKQTEMAGLLELAPRNYQRLEYGKTNVTATTLLFLCDYFHVSADYLLGRTDNREINR